jgi:hypothetical protein
VLPLGPTGYGESPYQCFSAWAGNPLLISLERLVEKGWLDASALAGAPNFPEDRVDFERLIPWKTALLECRRNRKPAGFDDFCEANQHWLDDFALFVALKAAPGSGPGRIGSRARAIAIRQALDKWREQLAEPIAAQKFIQFAFYEQWRELRELCAGARRADHGRLAHLRLARQRRRVGQPAVFSFGRAGQSDGGLRRAAGLFQRRPASFGAIRFIAGTRWPRTATAGGWIDFAPRLKWWI